MKGLAAAAGIAFGIAAVVNFGKASVSAATELSNAMMGLRSITEGQGRSFKAAQDFIQQYTADGLIPATNAITAYKNLASRGYTDPQIQTTLQALKDSAAFGRQASYSLGDAVTSATEGLKNENSILVDNAGVTKNVAKMWEDYAKSIGVSTQDLTKQQKIQAEYNGIMEETRFQTGDAAKLAGTYSGQVQQLGFNFNNLKVAVGKAILPIASAVLPSLNAIITALTRVANLFAQVTTALFGRQAAQQQAVANTATNIATSSNDAAKAQNKLADATKKAGKAADGALAGFDELNILQQDTASGSSAADVSTPDVSGGAVIDPIGGQEIGAGVTVSPAVQAAADTIRGIFAGLNTALIPTKVALAGLWGEFQRLGGFSWSALQDFYSAFLVPVGRWTLGTGLPGFINALRDGMSKINWGKINSSLHDLWIALAPFAVNVGSGLLWFWEKVLVPLGTWTMNNIVPLFLEGLAAAIISLNSSINILKPLGTWLYDNFLVPLGAWTGGAILGVLTGLKNILSGLAPVILGVVGAMTAYYLITKAMLIWEAVSKAMALGITAYEMLRNGVSLAATAQAVFNVTLAANPIGIVVVAIGALIAIIVVMIQHWDAVSAAAASCWNSIVNAWNAAPAWFDSQIVQPISLFFTALWDQVKAAGAAAWVWIQKAWASAGAWMNTNVVQPISKFFAGLWTGIQTAASNAWKSISGVWQTVSDWFTEHVISPIEKGFKGSINAMIGMVEGFVNSFIGGVNKIIEALNSIHIDVPKNIPKIGGIKFGFDIPTLGKVSIPRLATGAVIPPRAEFAAILGDQSNGRNIEAPEGLLRNIVRQEVGDLLGSQGAPNFTVESKGDLGALISLLRLEIRREDNRVGTAFATGGGRF
ncbi:hypothetical protein [Faecalispora anaeroviscerum]|uniref:hypothetical protein n=1 Tax=Faecalispora anaeroviscerum TaxID=2991836 RepID=UPI0024BA39B7|nr:hypothetical protein [Faecalispora anaeroviscerum]